MTRPCILVEIIELFSGEKKLVILPDNSVNRALYAGRIIYAGTEAQCRQKILQQ